VLSLGPELVRAPDLAGQAVAAAQVSLAGSGLRLGSTLTVTRGEAAPGIVVGQSPAADQQVARAATVDVLVAGDLAAEAYVMPDLVNLRYEPVRRFFESRGFRFASVQFEPYEGLPNGVVLRQQPLAGHPVARRDPLTLVVSGPRAGA